MRASILAPLALAALAVIGCRSGGNQELIERELRFQESELYRLHDQLDDATDKIDSLERENQSLRKELDGGGKSSASGSSSGPGDLSEPKVELPPGVGRSGRTAPRSQRAIDKAPPMELIVPSVVPGVEVTPGEPALVPNSDVEEIPPASLPPASLPPASLPPASLPPASLPPASLPPASLPPPGFDAQGASHQQPADQTPVSDHRLARIVLNKPLTGGPRGDSADDGDLRVVVEPHNAAGQFVKATGEISIVVLDPAVTGPAARVARWDYKPNEILAHYRSTDGARGYHFDLHWPGRPPAHGSLELFVRLKTSDGQRFIANQSIQVNVTEAIVGGKSASSDDGQFATGRGTATQHVTTATDDATTQVAARDAQRRRLFSRIRGGSDSSKESSAPPPPDSDGSLNITVPGADGAAVAPPATSGAAAVSSTPKSSRLIDRSKLMGGPGIFDGSRIRNLTGGKQRDDKAPPATGSGAGSEAPPYQPGGGSGNRGGDAPPFQASGAASSSSGDAPRFSPGSGASQDQGPAMPNVEIPEPIGGPPPANDDDAGSQSQVPAPPPAKRTARPVWRPYR